MSAASRVDRRQIRVLPEPVDVGRAAAALIRQRCAAANDARGRFTIALSGGSTPGHIYRALRQPEAPDTGRDDDLVAAAAGEVPPMTWDRTHVFWGDERTVPPDHPDSNFGAAREALLRHVPVPAGHVHRIRGEDDPAQAARDYAAALRRHVALGSDGLPRLDVIVLGLGDDCHTASLFPGDEALPPAASAAGVDGASLSSWATPAERDPLVSAPWVEKLGAHRITLTPTVLNAAATVVFVVAGATKAEAVRSVLEEPRDPRLRPAQVVCPEGGALIWLLDAAAADRLSSETRA